MEVNAYYTNFTFEEELKVSQTIQYQKINTLFEFLFLWIEDSSKILWTKYPYSKGYLEMIKSYTHSIPQLVQNCNEPELWWGDSRDLKEKLINEKKTSFLARHELGMELLDSFIAEDLAALEKLCADKEYIFKGYLGFSGRDQIRDRRLIASSSFPFIVEPLLKRKQDIGITFLSPQKYFAIENFNNEKGQFKGAKVLEEIPNHIVAASDKIFKWYCNKFNIQSLQIDMFSYLEKKSGTLKWNYLCEVNHRKTMGWVLWKLQQIFNTRYASFRIFKKNMDFKKISPNLKIVELSPPGHWANVIYIGSENKEVLDSYLQNLE